MTAREAVQLSAAALMQVAMQQGPGEFHPLNVSNRLLLQSLWETLHNTPMGLWSEETRALSSPIIRDVLTLSNSRRVLASCGGGRLPVPPGPVWRSRGCWPQAAGTATQLRDLLASIFLDTLPMAAPLAIPAAAFTSSTGHPPPGVITDGAGCLGGGLRLFQAANTPSLQIMPWSVTLAQRARRCTMTCSTELGAASPIVLGLRPP
jgi:hypothetical protein